MKTTYEYKGFAVAVELVPVYGTAGSARLLPPRGFVGIKLLFQGWRNIEKDLKMPPGTRHPAASRQSVRDCVRRAIHLRHELRFLSGHGTQNF